ncbi:MAG: tetratricopeptide repeat protein [Methylocystis sp.]|jgi:tetratricopeptide (TPR) repeat protein
MTPQKLLIVVVGVMAPLSGYLLLPHAEERFSMLMREGQYREAAGELEALVDSGDSRPFILAALARAYEASSDAARAIDVMRAYVSAHPKDPEGPRALARLYAAVNQPQAMIDALANLVALEPSKEDVVRLVALHRGFGRYDEERSLLLEMRESGFLEISHLQRLGELLAAAGDFDRAIETLSRVDENLAEDQERGRILLFDLLVSTGRADEAVTRAQRWLGAWRRPWVGMRLAQRFTHKSNDRQLDSLVLCAARANPEMKVPIARMLVANHRIAVAGRLLAIDEIKAKVATSESPTDADVSALVEAAEVMGDPRPVWAAFVATSKKRTAAKAQVALAESLVERFGVATVAVLERSLSAEALAHRPLFAARLALYDNNRQLARRILDKVDSRRLSDDERRSWAIMAAEAL